MCVCMKVQLHIFLTFALGGGKKSVSRLGWFISRKSAPLTFRIEDWVSPIPDLTAFENSMRW